MSWRAAAVALIAVLIVVAFLPCSEAVGWKLKITAGGSTWIIERQSMNLSFFMDDDVNGLISGVNITPSGRRINGYHSRYVDVDLNDVRLKERTGAKEGMIGSEDKITLNSSVDSDITFTAVKKKNSSVWQFETTEAWPVHLNSKRDLFYKGSGISDRDFAGNKLDYVGTAFLYSNNLSRTRSCEMSLVRMNASIFARSEEKKNTTDNSSAVDPQTNGVLQGYDGLILDNESSNESSNKSNITLIEGLTDVFFKPNRWIDYKAESYSDGVSIFRYRQADFDQLSMTKDRVNAVNEGYERYTGSYSMSQRLNMYSRAENSSQEVPWLCLSCEELDFSPPDLFNASCGS